MFCNPVVVSSLNNQRNLSFQHRTGAQVHNYRVLCYYLVLVSVIGTNFIFGGGGGCLLYFFPLNAQNVLLALKKIEYSLTTPSPPLQTVLLIVATVALKLSLKP